MRTRIALGGLLVVAAACSSPSPGPKGWQPMPGASAAWTIGSGSSIQEYSYSKRQFGGTLQDLASRVTIDALMQHRGARFRGSIPFASCPGAAGVATFAQSDGRTVQEGFAVHNGQALRITYARPSSQPPDPSATQAMQETLCAL